MKCEATKEAEVNCALMAAEQVSNFLLNGTIVNSVNFPSIKLGRTDNFRVVIINKNEPGMIGKIADKIACTSGRCGESGLLTHYVKVNIKYSSSSLVELQKFAMILYWKTLLKTIFL